jgi:hypothetical protein
MEINKVMLITGVNNYLSWEYTTYSSPLQENILGLDMFLGHYTPVSA